VRLDRALNRVFDIMVFMEVLIMSNRMRMEFFVGQYLRILLFLVFALWCTCLLADPSRRGFGAIRCIDILSDVFGFGAIVSINDDHELRAKLEITDQQLADVRKTIKSESLNKANKVALESASRDYLKRVLTNTQADKLRLMYVKARLRSPDRFFTPLILYELGVEPRQAEKLSTAMRIQLEAVNKKLDKLITQAISDALPPEAQDIFWSFVGSNLAIDTNGSDWRKIAVLPQTSSIWQLTLGTSVVLPNELALSQQQQIGMKGLMDDEIAKALAGNPSSEVEVSTRLDDALSNQQRFAIVQKIQQNMIRGNLSLAVCPEISKHFNLSDDNVNVIKAELEEAKKQIFEIESACLLEASKTVLKTSPLQVKDDILRLAEGIWELK
jgi:hypothetical protein